MNLLILTMIWYAYQQKYLIFYCKFKSYYLPILKLLRSYRYILTFKLRFNKLYIYLNYLFKVPAIFIMRCFFNKKIHIYMHATIIQNLLWLVSSSIWLFWTPFGLKPHWFLIKNNCGGILVAQLI